MKDRKFKYYLTDKIVGVVETIIKVGALVFCFYLFLDHLESTLTKILLAIVIIAVIALSKAYNVFYGKKIAEMSEHNKKLEKSMDKNRSSSNLTKTGLTKPEDK